MACIKLRAPRALSFCYCRLISLLDPNRRSSSSANTKKVLGVRKSCDASILSPMKHTLSGFVGSSNQHGSSNTIPPNSPSSPHVRSASKGDILGSSSTSPVNTSSTSLAVTVEDLKEVNLETAIQSKLNIRHSAKPRSRSLIWRPSRKARTSAEPECRVS